MATARNKKTTVLKLGIITGVSTKGTDLVGTRTINNINPEISDDDLLAIGSAIGELQTYEVTEVRRQDAAVLAAEA